MGGEYSVRVLPDEFLLKSVVMKVDFKRNSSARTRRYEYSPPTNALVSALHIGVIFQKIYLSFFCLGTPTPLAVTSRHVTDENALYL